MWPDQAYYTTKDMVTGRYKAHKLKGEEVAHVEQVRHWHLSLAAGKDMQGFVSVIEHMPSSLTFQNTIALSRLRSKSLL